MSEKSLITSKRRRLKKMSAHSKRESKPHSKRESKHSRHKSCGKKSLPKYS